MDEFVKNEIVCRYGKDIAEAMIEDCKKMDREELEENYLITNIRLRDIDKTEERNLEIFMRYEKENKKLKCEIERLKNVMHGIYQSVKLKSLKFIKGSNLSKMQSEKFFEIFDNFLS